MEPLLNSVGGDDRIKQQLTKDDAEILKLVRGLGDCRRGYQRERANSLKAIVSEIYSPPRVTQALKMLPSMGLIPGFALDLTTNDEDGNPWDFNCPRQRQKARKLRAETKPYFLVGSPCCTMYSTWGYINATRQDAEARRRAMLKADVHMRFVMELYGEQVKDGRYFLHEHPAWAT